VPRGFTRLKLQSVSLDDVEALAIGAGILGTGGGGNTYLARVRLDRELRLRDAACRIIDADELDDDALVCAVSGMGAPTVGIEKLSNGNEMVNGVRALESHLCRSFDALLIGEIGGSNGLRPLVAGLQLGLPVVDGDPMGRAFPELQMDTFSIGGVSPSPMLLCDVHGNTIIFDHIDTPQRAEEYARRLTVEMGGSATLIMPVLSGRQARQLIIRGTLSLALQLGQIVLQAREDKQDPAIQVAAAANGTTLFRGKVVDLVRRTTRGFARGRVSLAAFGASEDQMEIEFQNENLVARRGEEVVCSVPDLITMLSLEGGEPIGTGALRYGLRVAVIGMPAPKELKTEAALHVVGPAAFGYPDVEYVPLPGDLL
jgi:DUF917 family protein